MSALASVPDDATAPSLSEFIRQSLAESDSTDLDAMVAQVWHDLPPDLVSVAALAGLRAAIRQQFSHDRRQVTPSVEHRPAQPSAKVAAIRTWARHLEDRIHVGSGTYPRLRHCTYDDLTHAASERQKNARANAAWAKVLASWAADVKTAGVATFGDLPTDVQRRAIERIPR